MTDNSFNFDLTWDDILVDFAPELRAEVLAAIITYARTGTVPAEISDAARMAMAFIVRDIERARAEAAAKAAKAAEISAKRAAARRGNTSKSNNKQQTKTKPNNAEQPQKADSLYSNSSSRINNNNTTKKLNNKSTTTTNAPEDFFARLESDEAWAVAQCTHFGLNREQLSERIRQFREQCTLQGTIHGTYPDCTRHFTNWLPIRMRKENAITKQPTTNNYVTEYKSRSTGTTYGFDPRRGTEPSQSAATDFSGPF